MAGRRGRVDVFWIFRKWFFLPLVGFVSAMERSVTSIFRRRQHLLPCANNMPYDTPRLSHVHSCDVHCDHYLLGPKSARWLWCCFSDTWLLIIKIGLYPSMSKARSQSSCGNNICRVRFSLTFLCKPTGVVVGLKCVREGMKLQVVVQWSFTRCSTYQRLVDSLRIFTLFSRFVRV